MSPRPKYKGSERRSASSQIGRRIGTGKKSFGDYVKVTSTELAKMKRDGQNPKVLTSLGVKRKKFPTGTYIKDRRKN